MLSAKNFATLKIRVVTLYAGSCKILENNLNATFRALVTKQCKAETAADKFCEHFFKA